MTQKELVEQAIVLINQALEIEDDDDLAEAGEELSDWLEALDTCIECHTKLEGEGRGKEHNMCHYCYDTMLRDQAIDSQLQEWKDGERAINGRYRGQL